MWTEISQPNVQVWDKDTGQWVKKEFTTDAEALAYYVARYPFYGAANIHLCFRRVAYHEHVDAAELPALRALERSQDLAF